MRPQSTVVAHIDVTFHVDSAAPPPDRPIHDALRSVRALEIEAPTVEHAEHYAVQLMHELERAGN
jgi:hypothetical protein